MIHPKQMNVDHPSNTDDDLIDYKGNYAQPSEVFTETTFQRFRIEVAIVFREVVDSTWESGCDMDELPYDLVLEFDKRLNDLLHQLDKKINLIKSVTQEHNLSGAEDRKRSTKYKIFRQRNTNNFSIHTRLSRLHRPFLIRGVNDPRYAYSRMVCLRSARTVIEVGKVLMSSSDHLDSVKIVAFNHHIFVSTMILVIDYCFNRDEPRGKERKEEIIECFRILEGGPGKNTIATRGLHKLREILRKRSDNWDDEAEAEASSPRDLVAVEARPSSSSRARQEFTGPQGEDSNFAFVSDQNAGRSSDHQWPEIDFTTFEDINWDVNLDAGQFEALFEEIEGNHNMP